MMNLERKRMKIEIPTQIKVTAKQFAKMLMKSSYEEQAAFFNAYFHIRHMEPSGWGIEAMNKGVGQHLTDETVIQIEKLVNGEGNM